MLFTTEVMMHQFRLLVPLTNGIHKNIVANTIDNAKYNHPNDPMYPCIVNANVNANDNNENDIIIGHGDGATKWNGNNFMFPFQTFPKEDRNHTVSRRIDNLSTIFMND
ncbi:hypothetical protein DAMA08_021140 (mitochondrion) [Martiniozyma asiatica (nom. inval.)]|nr:hypothetical protein DAMA08_021140 [Martiniozyma asiatica]